ncbi:MAG: aminoglycoside phosphotransferase family protein [Christensenellaceae bacterium]|nr:aminoglycoside phosphotransferase family protein [Christensenellaceae bacterium]
MTANQAQFEHPKKWRETCDPFKLDYHCFRPTEILGYPHAGNDVFHVKGIHDGKEMTAYVKAARQQNAAIQNEVSILRQIDLPYVPRVIDFGFQDTPFLVTAEMPGKRLSVIVSENKDCEALSYMEEYGETLGRIHSMNIKSIPVSDRKFFHAPTDEILEKLGLQYLKEYFMDAPKESTTVFCHGDFHYANILWENHHISGILDFELSGYGNRDFDIAWALLLRPGQNFLKTEEERQRFLEGYGKLGLFDERAVKYYMAQSYVHFMLFSSNDTDYMEYARNWLLKNCKR